MMQDIKIYSESAAGINKQIHPFDVIADINNKISILFEAADVLTKKLEPVLFPVDNKADAGMSFGVPSNEANSTLTSRLLDISNSLYSLQYRLQQFPDHIQL